MMIDSLPSQQQMSIDVDMPPVSPPTVESKRRIRFDLQRNVVFHIWHVSELTSQELMDIWITAEEFMATKKDYTNVVRMMMKSREPLEETEELTCRGLGAL